MIARSAVAAMVAMRRILLSCQSDHDWSTGRFGAKAMDAPVTKLSPASDGRHKKSYRSRQIGGAERGTA
jgi:hypothetical protein